MSAKAAAVLGIAFIVGAFLMGFGLMCQGIVTQERGIIYTEKQMEETLQRLLPPRGSDIENVDDTSRTRPTG